MTSEPRVGAGRVTAAAGVALVFAAGCADFSRGERFEASLGAADDDGGVVGEAGALSFTTDIEPILQSRCSGCHSGGGAAANSGFQLTGDPALDYATVSGLVDTSSPTDSTLLIKVTGRDGHGGGAVLAADSPEYAALLQWVEEGAPQ